MTFLLNRFAVAALACAVFAAPASAHITLENKEVKAGSTTKFVLRVGHGCAGAATTAVRLEVPGGLSNAKPQPKAGWTLAIVAEAAHGDGGHGDGGAEAKEIAWTGGALEDAHYDEFVFRASVAKDAPATLFVPVVQECGASVERWIEIPAAGASSDDLESPAPSVRVEP